MTNTLRLKKRPAESYADLILRLYHSEDRQARCRQVTFQVTEDCCMACTYCYQNHKTTKYMTWETIKPFLDELLNDENELINTGTNDGLVLDFIGGEPLLQIDLIDQICTYMFNGMIERHHPWLLKTRISICSNGLLYFEPKVQAFIHKFLGFCDIGFSIDGDKILHDTCRVDKDGNGTYDRAMAAIKDCHERYHAPLTTKMTISPDNVRFTYRALKNLVDNNFSDIWVNCIYEEGWTYEHATILYYELKQLADYLIDTDKFNKVFVRFFTDAAYTPIPNSETTNWCGGTADNNLAISPDGKIFTCIRYMESSLNGHQKELPIGDIQNGYLSTDEYKENIKLMSGVTRQAQSTDECLNCQIARGCGWCSAYNYEKFGTVLKRATFICPMHKAASLAAVYYWNKLYKKFNINDIFEMYLPEEEIDKIIPQQEKELLYQLVRK